MKNKLPALDVVETVIQIKKQLIRQMEWSRRHRGNIKEWEFRSYMYLGTTPTEYEDLFLHANYKPNQWISKGMATIEIQEECCLAIILKGHRIFAMDMRVGGLPHRNVMRDSGLPYDGELIDSNTHCHIWTRYGAEYAEPVQPDISDVEELFSVFTARATLYLNGMFSHPMKLQQPELF